MGLFVRRTFGIQARLMMLAVVTALPLVALGSLFILRMVEDQREQIKQDVSHRVENLLWDVDRQISAERGGASRTGGVAEPAGRRLRGLLPADA